MASRLLHRPPPACDRCERRGRFRRCESMAGRRLAGQLAQPALVMPVPSRSDVREGLPALHSLDAALASPSWLRSASNAGSTARASPTPCPSRTRQDRVCPSPRDGVDGKRRHGCRSAAVFEQAKSRMDAASVRREGVGRPEPVGRGDRRATAVRGTPVAAGSVAVNPWLGVGWCGGALGSHGFKAPPPSATGLPVLPRLPGRRALASAGVVRLGRVGYKPASRGGF